MELKEIIPKLKQKKDIEDLNLLCSYRYVLK